jgi:pimeloyl-ACP methyl ester carboxylesterase
MRAAAYDPPMPRAATNGIELEYDLFGSPADPTIVVISGLGGQSPTNFYDAFCDELAGRGYQVVRFDNRDNGLSSMVEAGGYSLSDMALDAVGLLDFLGVDAAHVVGLSMGGMIAQTIAIEHPARVLTLTSIMSTTGAPGVGAPTEAGAARLMAPGGETRDERVASGFENCRVWWGDSPEFPFDAELAQWRSELAVDRSNTPEGTVRQFLAIQASGDRTDKLRTLDVPTLVIHGTNDSLIDVSGGEATAAAIPGAELVLIEGMGHGLARPAWTDIIATIDRLAARTAAVS